MMASYDWHVRHAGLMAIAAIEEGTGKVRAFLGSSRGHRYMSHAGDAK